VPSSTRRTRARRALAVTGLSVVLTAPASQALAVDAPATTVLPAVSVRAADSTQDLFAEHLRDVAHARALRSTMRTARKLARVKGKTVEPGVRRRLARHSTRGLVVQQNRLRAELRRLRAEQRRARAQRSTGGAPDVAIPSQLAAIAACESGGNPAAIGGGGTYRGKYQFSYETWAAVGGSGDPAAAPEVEQDRRAAILYASAGAGQWPVCGR
jgi:hypothetical protein